MTNWLSLRRTKSESLLVTFYTFKDVDSMFCWHFCTFRNSICDQLFDVNMTGHLQNEFVFLPCKIIKMKRWNSWAGFFPLALFLFNGNNRRANIDAGGGYCVIIVLWICTTWRKVENKIAQKNNGWVIMTDIPLPLSQWKLKNYIIQWITFRVKIRYFEICIYIVQNTVFFMGKFEVPRLMISVKSEFGAKL